MKFGICDLTIIPMRSENNDKSEMINQVIFGEIFKIIEKQKNYSKIRLAHDNYIGWICNKQWTEIDKDEYNKLNKETHTISSDIIEIIKYDYNQTVVIGSILPSFKSGYCSIKEKLYKFDGLSTQGFSNKEKIIENALCFIKVPYLWGGRSPFGIDCSGFTQILYRLQGIKIPRDASQQSEVGTTLSFIEESQPGDLAFFDNEEGRIIHVGIIMKNNHIIHSSGEVRIDRLDQQGIFNKDTGNHTHKLRLIKSII